MKTSSKIRNGNILLKWLFLAVLSTGFQCFHESGFARLNRIELVGETLIQHADDVIVQITKVASHAVTPRFYDCKNRQAAFLAVLNQRLSNLTSNIRDNCPYPLITRQNMGYQHLKTESLTSEDPFHFQS